MKACTVLFLFSVILFFIVGCATGAFTAHSLVEVPAGVPDRLAEGYQKMVSAKKKDKVLHQLEFALDAFQLGKDEIAQKYLSLSMDEIEKTYVRSRNNELAATHRYGEDQKDYRGEAYERMMVYYYAALLQMKSGNMEQARVLVRAAEAQDFYRKSDLKGDEGRLVQSDASFLYYLRTWLSHQLNEESQAAEAARELESILPSAIIPKADHNVLVIVETGGAPRKLRDGISGDKLVYRRAKKAPDPSVVLKLDGGNQSLSQVEDIFWQASSRGGRAVDHILNGQAKFKDSGSSFGTRLGSLSEGLYAFSEQLELREAGLSYADRQSYSGSQNYMAATIDKIGIASQDLSDLGVAVGGISVLASLVAMNTNAKCDIRSWRNLPDKIFAITLNGGAGGDAVLSVNPAGDILPSEHAVHLQAGTQPQLIWIRESKKIISHLPRKG